jgi:hypothetical protein
MSKEVKEPKFKKQLIWFDKKGYEDYSSKGRQKLILLAQAVEYMSRHLKKVDSKQAYEEGFESYFMNRLLNENKKFTDMGINNPLKILNLLDINVSELIKIEDEFNELKYKLEWKDGKANVKTDKEMFCVYTRNEDENTNLEIANKLIKSIQEVSDVKTLQPLVVLRAFNGFINYNWTSQEYTWNFNNR